MRFLSQGFLHEAIQFGTISIHWKRETRADYSVLLLIGRLVLLQCMCIVI